MMTTGENPIPARSPTTGLSETLREANPNLTSLETNNPGRSGAEIRDPIRRDFSVRITEFLGYWIPVLAAPNRDDRQK
jgi:hypothetical protein